MDKTTTGEGKTALAAAALARVQELENATTAAATVAADVSAIKSVPAPGAPSGVMPSNRAEYSQKAKRAVYRAQVEQQIAERAKAKHPLATAAAEAAPKPATPESGAVKVEATAPDGASSSSPDKPAVEMATVPLALLRGMAKVMGLELPARLYTKDRLMLELAKHVANTLGRVHPTRSLEEALSVEQGRGKYGFAFWNGNILQEHGQNTGESLAFDYKVQQQAQRHHALVHRVQMTVEHILADPLVRNCRFMFGKTTCPKPDGTTGGKTRHLRAGMVKRFGQKYAPAGYRFLICLAVFTRSEDRAPGEYVHPEQEAVELEADLWELFGIHEDFDDSLSSIQSGSKSMHQQHEIYAMTYIAIGPRNVEGGGSASASKKGKSRK